MQEDDKEMEIRITPRPTLYVRNLNDKIKTEGKKNKFLFTGYLEMRIQLYLLFSTYGEVVQVRMRDT